MRLLPFRFSMAGRCVFRAVPAWRPRECVRAPARSIPVRPIARESWASVVRRTCPP